MSKRVKKHGERSAAVRRDARGRTHLVIQRDAFGREVGLALAAPLFEETWQNEVALGAAASAHARLADGHTFDNAAAIGRDAMTGTSKIVDGALARAPERPPACRAGCAHCCHQAVGVTPPEVFAIYDHLRATRTGRDLEALLARVRAADDRTRGMPAAERISADLPCPFLRDERCSIYEVRPLSCRGTNSLDAAAASATCAIRRRTPRSSPGGRAFPVHRSDRRPRRHRRRQPRSTSYTGWRPSRWS